VDNKYFNLITPDVIKNTILRQNKLLKVHFYNLEEIYSILLYSFDDNDILKYAYHHNLTFADSNKLLNTLRSYKLDNSTSDINNYECKQEEAIQNNYLHADDVNKYLLSKYEVLIYGYDKNSFSLIKLLNDNNIQFRFIDDLEFSKLFNINLNQSKHINIYQETFKECLINLNDIFNKLTKEEFNLDDFLIVCPETYLKVLTACGNLYNIKFNFNFIKYINVEGVKAIVETFSNNLDINYVQELYKKEKENSNNLNNYLLLTLEKIIHILVNIYPWFSKEENKNNVKFKDLIKEYLNLKLSSYIKPQTYINGINVVTNINQMYGCKYVYFLGFNDLLINVATDNDLILDIDKKGRTYQLTCVEKNKNTIELINTFIKLNSHLKISYSSFNATEQYNLSSLFMNKEGFISYPQDEKGNIIENNDEFVLNTKDANKLYASIALEKYSKTLNKDQYFIDCYEKLNLENEISNYNNDFKLKDPNYSLFKTFFDDKLGSTLSHTSFDQYLNNPFDFYCKYILKIYLPQTSNPLIGTVAHNYIESGETRFDDERFNKEFEDVIKNVDFQSYNEDFTRNSLYYFAKLTYKNAEKNIKPFIDSESIKAQFKQIILNIDQDKVTEKDKEINKEFEGKFEIKPKEGKINKPFYVTIKIDGIFELVGENKYFVVDYKTTSKGDGYYNFSNALKGRKQQLLLYVLFADQLFSDKNLNMPQYKDYSYLSGKECMGGLIFPILSKDNKVYQTQKKELGFNKVFLGFSLDTNIKMDYVSFGTSLFAKDGDFSMNHKNEIPYITYAHKYYDSLNKSDYDLSLLKIDTSVNYEKDKDQVYTPEEKRKYNQVLLNITALELLYVVNQLRKGVFNINPAYDNHSPINAFSDYKDISFERLNQRHYLDLDRNNPSFNDFNANKTYLDLDEEDSKEEENDD